MAAPAYAAPSTANTVRSLLEFVQSWHDKRVASKSWLAYFPDFPRKKTEVKVVSSGVVFEDDGKLGAFVAANYELSTAAGARCAEQNAFGLLMHYGVAPAAVRYLACAGHSVFADGRSDEPLALTPCPVCRDIIRGVMKRSPGFGDVQVLALPSESLSGPTLRELVLAEGTAITRGGMKRDASAAGLDAAPVCFRTQLELIVMDCDGVIFDSNDLKTSAYRAAITAMEGEALAERFVREIHLRDVSVARGVKFEEFFSTLAPKPAAERQTFIDRAFEAYAAGCKRAYAELAPKAAALAVARRAPTYVVSGGDHAELQWVFRHHGITSTFREVRGSGVGGATKPKHIEQILERTGVAPANILFIGDGWTDFKTAQQFGIHFAFLREMSDWHAWREQTAAAAPGTMSIYETWDSLAAAFER
uniref:Uncharacterized protein n=1 Tax=Alexandrium monilatum TaxID=311494 RepID=A0A7S4WCW4_9DINO